MNHLEIIPVYDETLFTDKKNKDKPILKIGNFERKVMTLVHQTDWSEENEDFIKKILLAGNLQINDYLIMVIQNQSQLFEVINQHKPEILFLFGLNLDHEFFKSNKSMYKPFILNDIKIALCDGLNQVKTDKEKRLLLWNQCIKPIFNIQ